MQMLLPSQVVQMCRSQFFFKIGMTFFPQILSDFQIQLFFK